MGVKGLEPEGETESTVYQCYGCCFQGKVALVPRKVHT